MSDCALFCTSIKLRVCVTNFDHLIIIWFSDLRFVKGAYLTDGKFSCHISFFVFTFCRLLELSQKLNMTFKDYQDTQFGHNTTAELYKCGLLWKLSTIFGFHRNQCKMQIFYGNVTRGWNTLFLNQMHQFTGYAQFFYFMLFLLSKIVSYGVQKVKGNNVFRKIEICHVWHIASSVAQKEILWTSVVQAVSRQFFQMCAVKSRISPGYG